MTTTYWACCECEASGTYEAKQSGGAADKHTRETQHATLAGFPENYTRDAAARAREKAS